MKEYIEERVVNIAQFIINNNATVRCAAKKFCVSKSTVHKDVTERLEEIDISLSKKVLKILNENKAQRHIRGGIATREKYKKLKKSIAP